MKKRRKDSSLQTYLVDSMDIETKHLSFLRRRVALHDLGRILGWRGTCMQG
jgi:hypothetical protein